MKKIIVLLISAMIIFTACSSASSEKHDFGNVDFGMSTIELVKIEGEPDSKVNTENVSGFTYLNKEVFGLPNATVLYTIDENGLKSISVLYDRDYADNKSYITEYNTVKERLIKDWGEPQSITENDEKFKYDCMWYDSDIKALTLFKSDDNKVCFHITGLRKDEQADS